MRIEGKKKLGYYPTPDVVVDIVKTYLDMTAGKFASYDPCCGKGDALARLLRGTQGIGYGCELNEAFVPEAKIKLFKVARGGYEGARVSNNAVSLLFLNPPYDTHTGTETEQGMRKEYIFLKDTIRYLKNDGVLVYIIPQERLVENIARTLVYKFRKIQVFKFPGEEYDAFGQVVILGILKDKGSQDKAEVERLIEIGLNPDTTPELEQTSIPEYPVPLGSEVSKFRSALLNNEEVVAGMPKSTLRKNVKLLTMGESYTLDAEPVIKTHLGHDAMLLASGYGNGVLGTGENRHLLHGQVVKVSTEEIDEVVDPNGQSREVKKVTNSHSVRIVLRKGTTGEVVTLM